MDSVEQSADENPLYVEELIKAIQAYKSMLDGMSASLEKVAKKAEGDFSEFWRKSSVEFNALAKSAGVAKARAEASGNGVIKEYWERNEKFFGELADGVSADRIPLAEKRDYVNQVVARHLDDVAHSVGRAGAAGDALSAVYNLTQGNLHCVVEGALGIGTGALIAVVKKGVRDKSGGMVDDRVGVRRRSDRSGGYPCLEAIASQCFLLLKLDSAVEHQRTGFASPKRLRYAAFRVQKKVSGKMRAYLIRMKRCCPSGLSLTPFSPVIHKCKRR